MPKLYSDRKEWSDVTPMLQDDGPNPIVPISYSAAFSDVMNYFRAVLHANEKSQRVLDLTSDAIYHNPANYTIWEYRRQVLRALECPLDAELEFVSKLVRMHPKNYQLWNHRKQLIIDNAPSPLSVSRATSELEFCAKVLIEDAKNYHTWAYRQWILLQSSEPQVIITNEISNVDFLLQKDIRNNSAWNQRWFIGTKLIKKSTTLSDSHWKNEINVAIQAIRRAPDNESPWNYLRACMAQVDSSSVINEMVEKECVQLKELHPNAVQIYLTLLYLYEKQLPDKKQEVTDILSSLESTLDPIRAPYYKHRKSKLV